MKKLGIAGPHLPQAAAAAPATAAAPSGLRNWRKEVAAHLAEDQKQLRANQASHYDDAYTHQAVRPRPGSPGPHRCAAEAAAARGAMRNVNLDALRGVAILMVLGRHLDYFPLWTKMGWAGVDLFFVLSGFLISGLLFQEWKVRGAIDFKRFYIRRAFKIYPAFYALLLVTVLVNLARPGISSHPVTWKAMLAEALFVQNYFPGVWGQTWSLAVEEHFYILLPIALCLLYRRHRTHADPFRALPAIFMAVATVEIVLRGATTWHLTTAATELRYMAPSHLRIDALLFGVMLSYYRQFQPEKFDELRRGLASLLLIALAGILLAILPLNHPIMHTAGFTLVYFGFGLLLVRTIDMAPRRHLSRLALVPLSKIGYYSYSIYLWHGFVCRLLPHATFVSMLGCIVAAILLGALMGKVIEYPALALRDRILPTTRHVAQIPLTTTMA
jgi:peptidoglycan/LPS O-acetylase OafA/YrhL